MASKNTDAEFNLLSSDKNKIKKKSARSIANTSSVKYSLALIIGAVFFFLILQMVQMFVIDARKKTIQTKIDTVEDSLSQFNDTIGANGELVTKSRLLQNVLLEDVKLEKFLDLVNEINANKGQILSYEKSNTGFFVFTIEFENEEDVVATLASAIDNEQTTEVFARQILTDRLKENSIILTVQLRIKDE